MTGGKVVIPYLLIVLKLGFKDGSLIFEPGMDQLTLTRRCNISDESEQEY